LPPISVAQNSYNPRTEIKSRLWLHDASSWACQSRAQTVLVSQSITRLHELLACLLRAVGERLLVAGEVVEQAVRDDGKVVGQVERRGDYKEGEEEEED
jgi:hypothetical protein